MGYQTIHICDRCQVERPSYGYINGYLRNPPVGQSQQFSYKDSSSYMQQIAALPVASKTASLCRECYEKVMADIG